MRVSNVAKFGGALLAGLMASGFAYADTIKPAVIYDLGGKFDKSFNEGVFNGATKFQKDTGIPFRDLELQNEAQREQSLRKFAKDGFSPILVPGFSWATALGKIADEYPEDQIRASSTWSSTSRMWRRCCSRADEGSFLVGVIAAKTSQDRQARLRRRHGHSAHPRLRMRLRAGRQVRERQATGHHEHDGHRFPCLERSGEGRRTRQGADGPGRRHRLRRGRRDRAGRAEGGGGRRQARHRRRLRTRTICSPARC